jgi:hypothetical protein
MDMRRLLDRTIRFAGTTCLLLLPFGGCKKAVAPEDVAALTLVSGGSQTRQAGRQLRAPLVFRATSESGAGVGGAAITLIVVQGGGAVDSASIRTDANGEARIRWTLGPASTAQMVQATVPSVEPLLVPAIGILPSDVVVAQGANQTARVGVALPNTIVVRVLGGNSVPMDSVNVTFQITGGGGAISPQSALTNSFGEATARWTMGPLPGANTAVVRAGAIDPIIVTATATP